MLTHDTACTMISKTRFFREHEQAPDTQLIRCSLCPHACIIHSGKFGCCGIRGNKSGQGLIPYYGHITAIALDPIEKKPLYHFRPGTAILSLGFSGCNLHCPFCQNWHISQNPDAKGKQLRPEDIISMALREMPEKPAIAYTYSEPLVHAEFLLDCMAQAHRQGIANVLVTNGCINNQAAQEILSLCDAANIDLKCFSEQTYSHILGGDLDTVLNFIKLSYSMGVHTEITTLIVPELNDSDAELDRIAYFIAGLKNNSAAGPDIPWHLSAYHPDYRWNAQPTDPEFIRQTALRAGKILGFVYTGNIAGESNNTLCMSCGAVLIRRNGYAVNTAGLSPASAGEKFHRCAVCNAPSPAI